MKLLTYSLLLGGGTIHLRLKDAVIVIVVMVSAVIHEGYGLEIDMWALGVILYILLCGFPPFRSPDRRQTQLFQSIKEGSFEFLRPYWDGNSKSKLAVFFLPGNNGAASNYALQSSVEYDFDLVHLVN